MRLVSLLDDREARVHLESNSLRERLLREIVLLLQRLTTKAHTHTYQRTLSSEIRSFERRLSADRAKATDLQVSDHGQRQLIRPTRGICQTSHTQTLAQIRACSLMCFSLALFPVSLMDLVFLPTAARFAATAEASFHTC